MAGTEVTAFNVGVNAGAAAGQTVFHCHIHLIPRRPGDVLNPRGGVRRYSAAAGLHYVAVAEWRPGRSSLYQGWIRATPSSGGSTRLHRDADGRLRTRRWRSHPTKTWFHELAHVLGHTTEREAGLTDSERTPSCLQEVEAEAVALVYLEALGLKGAEQSRGYIQAWNARRGAEPIPEGSAQRIFKAADQILKAGTTEGAEQ